MLDEISTKHIFNTLALNCNGEISDFNPSVYPNPGNGDFTLDLSGTSEIVDISVLNVLGQQVADQINDGSRTQKIKVDLKGFPPGIYRLQISSRDGSDNLLKSLNVIIR